MKPGRWLIWWLRLTGRANRICPCCGDFTIDWDSKKVNCSCGYSAPRYHDGPQWWVCLPCGHHIITTKKHDFDVPCPACEIERINRKRVERR